MRPSDAALEQPRASRREVIVAALAGLVAGVLARTLRDVPTLAEPLRVVDLEGVRCALFDGSGRIVRETKALPERGALVFHFHPGPDAVLVEAFEVEDRSGWTRVRRRHELAGGIMLSAADSLRVRVLCPELRA